MNPPKYIYKYQPLDFHTLENIKGQRLYYGSPLQFNDPYDCAVYPHILNLTELQIENVRRHYLDDLSINEKIRNDVSAYPPEKLKEILMRTGVATLTDSINEFLAKRGVTCFSEKNDDLLMWSHYGGHYKGFCLEFSTNLEPFSKLRRVKYKTDLPSLDLEPLLLGSGEDDQFLELFCTKSLAWEYEKEWRSIHNVAGTKYIYHSESLTGIYFGPDISKESLEILCLVLGGQNETVKYWRGFRSNTEFKVLFENFTYTPHIEAKRKGLV